MKRVSQSRECTIAPDPSAPANRVARVESQAPSGDAVVISTEQPDSCCCSTYYRLGIINIPAGVTTQVGGQDLPGNPNAGIAGVRGAETAYGNSPQMFGNSTLSPSLNFAVRDTREALIGYLRRRYLLPAFLAIVPIMMCIYVLYSGNNDFLAYALGFGVWLIQMSIAVAVYSAILKKYEHGATYDLSEFLDRRAQGVRTHQVITPQAPPPRYSSCGSTYALPTYTENDVYSTPDPIKATPTEPGSAR